MRFLKRDVVSNGRVVRTLSGLCCAASALILLLGFKTIERMEFTESQLYSVTVETVLLAAVFALLAAGVHRWRQTA